MEYDIAHVIMFTLCMLFTLTNQQSCRDFKMWAIFPPTCVYISHTDAFAFQGMFFVFLAVKHIEITSPAIIEVQRIWHNLGIFCVKQKGLFGVIRRSD
jgi:E3 ubiquitin-protein ligase DOA10